MDRSVADFDFDVHFVAAVVPKVVETAAQRLGESVQSCRRNRLE